MEHQPDDISRTLSLRKPVHGLLCRSDNLKPVHLGFVTILCHELLNSSCERIVGKDMNSPAGQTKTLMIQSFYIGALAPCIGLQMPLTPSFKLLTTLPPFTLLNFSPFASLKSSAFFSTCSFAKFRTQIAFSLPLIYVPRMIGCRDGRGET